MNYRLVQDRFLQIKERSGVVENNGSGYIELAIVSNSSPIIDDPSNIKVEKHGKHYYKLDEGYNLYARSVTYLVCDINASEIEMSSDGGSVLPQENYYTKSQIDSTFVKKDGKKVLSDNNFTDEDKNKLDNIKAEMVTFSDGETFQQKLDENKLKGEDGKSAYELAVSNGFRGNEKEYISSLRGQNSPLPLTIALEKTSDSLAYKYVGNININSKYENGIPFKTYGDEICHMEKLNVIGLPNEATHLRCDIFSFFGEDKYGANTGSINPTRKVNGKDLYPYLKNLDPTKDIKFEVMEGKCEIQMDFNYESITSDILTELKQYFPNTIRVGVIQIELTVLNGESIIGKAIIRHTFTKSLDNNELRPIITLAELLPKNIEKMTSIGNNFNINYCTESEYLGLSKIRDDSTVYMVLNENNGEISMRVYRP